MDPSNVYLNITFPFVIYAIITINQCHMFSHFRYFFMACYSFLTFANTQRDARSLPLDCHCGGGGTLLVRLFAAHHHHSQMINKHKTLSRTPVISFCFALPLVAAQASHNPSIAIFMDLNGTTLTSQRDNFISIKTQFGASILIIFGIQIIAILSSKKERIECQCHMLLIEHSFNRKFHWNRAFWWIF